MLIYEVNLAVDTEVVAEFERWLDPHVEEILALPGFVSATVYDRDLRDEGDTPDGRRHLTVHYRLDNRDALEAYLAEHAPRMREDGLRRFPGRFTASRRVLDPR